MAVDSAKCPHCGSHLSSGDIEELEVDSTGKIVPMGANKSSDGVLYVCSSCNTILG